MNLIDILNQILSTKNEIKDIINESNDISRYSITIHNLLAETYNKGFVDGYKDEYESTLGFESYPVNPREYLEYTSNDTSNYDPYSFNGLVDIMRDVLGYRLDMKEELEIDSDYFPSYPSYLINLLGTVYESAFSDGSDKADEDINPTTITVLSPTFTYSDNVFSLTTTQSEASLYYRIGDIGKKSRYTSSVTISENCRVYYWAVVGKSVSYSGSIPYYDCTFSSTGTIPSENDYVYPPVISRGTGDDVNKIFIYTSTSDSSIWYSVDGVEYMRYVTSFELPSPREEAYVISAYATKNNVYSTTSTESFIYEGGSVVDEREKCGIVLLEQSQENLITLTPSTSGSTIYYKFDDGNWNTYSSPFTLTLQNTILWTYSTKTGYRDSDKVPYPLTLIQTLVKCSKPTFYVPGDGGRVMCKTTTSGAVINYKIGFSGEFITTDSGHISITPNSDCVIYAFASKDGCEDSDIESYEFNYYSQYFNLTAPTLELINNHVVMSKVDGDCILYTTNGLDPRVYGMTYVDINDGFRGIPISETTTFRAIVMGSDDDLYNHFSDETVSTFTPVSIGDEGYIPKDEYMNVLGASEIHITGNINGRYNLSYSYNKVDWTPFVRDVTGLDPTKRIYLQTYGSSGYKLFDSMYFGSNDRVSVSGNVMSIIINGDFTTTTTAGRDRLLFRLFKDCTSLVDAKDLVIPLTELNSYDMKEMFSGCSNLVNAPSKLYFNSIKRESCYRMFYNCTSLVLTPSMSINTVEESGCYEMFRDCNNISIVEGFNLTNTSKEGFKNAFTGCTNLVKVDLSISGVVGESAFSECFKDCTSIRSRSVISGSNYIDNIKITTTSLSSGSYYHMFENCTSLTSFSSLPATTAEYACYEGMFKDCTSFTTLESLSLVNVSERCCYEMFSGCRSMTDSPSLNAPNLTRRNCYSRMFYNCSSLNHIIAKFLTDPHGGTYTDDWVVGVSSVGTFEQDADATWFEESVDAIPVGWTIFYDENSVGRITSITNIYDKVRIECSNGNDIYYQINSSTGEWTKYTGEFVLERNARVYARCLSNRGVWGSIESVVITIESPLLTISSQDNIVTISKPIDYDYVIIYYRLYTYQQLNLVQDWTVYSSPFSIDTSYRVSAYGTRSNGTDGPVTDKDIVFGISKPEITNNNNVVTITCSTPNIESIRYKIGSGSYTRYTEPFVISENCTISSYATFRDPHTGHTYDSEVSVVDCIYSSSGSSYVLHVPVLERREFGGGNSTNQIYVRYDNTTYLNWTRNDIKIKYRINNGTWMLYEAAFVINENSTIEVYAYDNFGVESGHATYYFEKIDGVEIVVVPSPQIKIVKDESMHQNCLYLSNSDSRAINYFRIENAVGYNPFPDNVSLNGVYLSNQLVSGTIVAYSTISGYISNSSSYEYHRDETPVIVTPSKPVIEFSENTITITCSTIGADIYYSYDNVTYSRYTSPITISQTVTVYAYSQKSGYNSEINVKVCTYGGGGGSESQNYLTFTFIESCTLIWENEEGRWDYNIIEYSINGGRWRECRGYDEYRYITALAGFVIRFRGDNPNGFSPLFHQAKPHFEITGGLCNISGNIMSLLSKDNFSNMIEIPNAGCFMNLFANCDAIINTDQLVLPAIILKENCYMGMFYNCTNMVTAPISLPSTLLADGCYQSMFKKCTSLVKAPTLPASTLVSACYFDIFYNCNHLNYAKIMATSGYGGQMFDESTPYYGTIILATNSSLKNNYDIQYLINTKHWTLIESDN